VDVGCLNFQLTPVWWHDEHVAEECPDGLVWQLVQLVEAAG
jgi:hypothetical protein